MSFSNVFRSAFDFSVICLLFSSVSDLISYIIIFSNLIDGRYKKAAWRANGCSELLKHVSFFQMKESLGLYLRSTKSEESPSNFLFFPCMICKGII